MPPRPSMSSPTPKPKKHQSPEKTPLSAKELRVLVNKLDAFRLSLTGITHSFRNVTLALENLRNDIMELGTQLISDHVEDDTPF